jgi:uncharacterized protein YggT (Ycf19 family)
MFILDIVLSILNYVLYVYSLFLVIAGVLSLVGANPYNPIVTFFRAITAPPCRYLVKRFPALLMRTGNGYLDLSPLILILVLGALMIVIQKIAFYLGIIL